VMMEILLTAERIDAQRAYEVGLVNRVVPDAELVAESARLARRIAELAPLTVEGHKRVVQIAGEMGRSAALDVADMLFEPVYRSEDAQEGPRAFVERRPPVWSGR
jgi:enoyl-CoA hydratase